MEDEAVFCPNCGTAAAPAVEMPAPAAEESAPSPAPVIEESAPAAETAAAQEPAPEPAPEPVVEEPAPAVEIVAAQEQGGFTYAGAAQESAAAPKQEAAPQEPLYRYQPAVQAQPVYQQAQPIYQQPYQQPQPVYQQAQPVYQQAQPVYQQPVYAPVPNAADAEDQTVSTAKFFWFRVLFAIPLVGFILSIVMSFAPKNKSFKHFARSYMIMNFIAIGIVLVICCIVLATGASLADFYYDLLYSMY